MTEERLSSPEEEPETGPGSRRRRRVFFAVTGTFVVGMIYVFRSVLVPFALAIVLAYVLSPLVSRVERLQIRRWHPPRWVAVLCVYLALLGTLSALLAVAVPRLVAEINRLASEAPRVARTVRTEWLPAAEKQIRDALALYSPAPPPEEDEVAPQPEPAAQKPTSIRIEPLPAGGYEIVLPPEGVRIQPDQDNAYRVTTSETRAKRGGVDLSTAVSEAITRFTENTERMAATLLKTAQAIVRMLSRGLLTFVLTLMVSAYLLITSDRIFDFARSLYRPSRRHQFDQLTARIDRGLAGVVRGQLLICLVNGVLSGIGFYALGLKYWSFLTLLATVFSIVPIFGAIASSVPAVLIALQDGAWVAVLVLGWIVIIHQLEANLLNPKIMGDAAKVHPVLVVFALLAGEHLAGIVGALLAVPTLSIAQSLFLHYRELALGVPRAS